MTKKLKSYRFDDATIQSIDDLRVNLELDSNSAVIRKAIKLLKMAADSDGILLFVEGGKERQVLL